MPAPQPHDPTGDTNGKSGNPSGVPDLVAEAEALPELLHEATGRTARLVGALKHQRRQERAVRTAMASLRQLQPDP